VFCQIFEGSRSHKQLLMVYRVILLIRSSSNFRRRRSGPLRFQLGPDISAWMSKNETALHELTEKGMRRIEEPRRQGILAIG
jgi:hypothetical protein